MLPWVIPCDPTKEIECENCRRRQGHELFKCYWGTFVRSKSRYLGTERTAMGQHVVRTTRVHGYRIEGSATVLLCHPCVRGERTLGCGISLLVALAAGAGLHYLTESGHRWFKASLGEFGIFLAAMIGVVAGLVFLGSLWAAADSLFGSRKETGDRLAITAGTKRGRIPPGISAFTRKGFDALSEPDNEGLRWTPG
ncbi:MAG: hypothetical protein K2W96_11480 [Gemmataceae bacterium]|nr:hypothetical protein [Gemmataceae bacterium]